MEDTVNQYDEILGFRELGARLKHDMDKVINKAQRQSDVSGESLEDILFKKVKKFKPLHKYMRHYIDKCGYQLPEKHSLKDLINAFNICWHETNEHIQNHYDADNFSFTSQRRKDRRRRRRWRRKHPNEPFPDDVIKGDEQPTQPQEQTQQPPVNDAPSKIEDMNASQQMEVADRENQVSNPDIETADDEQLANEFENDFDGFASDEWDGDNWDGSDSFDGTADNFLPFLAGAISLGTKAIQAAKAAKEKGIKIGLGDIGKLFKKDAFKNMTIEDAAKLQATTDAAKKADPDVMKTPPMEVLNKGIAEITAGIEKEKKKEFLKENALYIILAIVALLWIGKKL